MQSIRISNIVKSNHADIQLKAIIDHHVAAYGPVAHYHYEPNARRDTLTTIAFVRLVDPSKHNVLISIFNGMLFNQCKLKAQIATRNNPVPHRTWLPTNRPNMHSTYTQTDQTDRPPASSTSVQTNQPTVNNMEIQTDQPTVTNNETQVEPSNINCMCIKCLCTVSVNDYDTHYQQCDENYTRLRVNIQTITEWKCPICYVETFNSMAVTDVRVLPCGHCMCMDCFFALQQASGYESDTLHLHLDQVYDHVDVLVSGGGGVAVSCPTCRRLVHCQPDPTRLYLN